MGSCLCFSSGCSPTYFGRRGERGGVASVFYAQNIRGKEGKGGTSMSPAGCQMLFEHLLDHFFTSCFALHRASTGFCKEREVFPEHSTLNGSLSFLLDIGKYVPSHVLSGLD